MNHPNIHLLFLLVSLFGCSNYDNKGPSLATHKDPVALESNPPKDSTITVLVDHDVKVSGYFEFLDSLILNLDSTIGYTVDEYALVHANPWIIDTLVHTDYYIQKEMGNFAYDQTQMLVLPKNTSLKVPSLEETKKIAALLENTTIDLNIPEFKLRIIQNDSVIFNFPVRVGRNERKFLAMAGREVDLRTHAGTGTIVRINHNPQYINPSNNHRYDKTQRDDGQYTKLPRIPWLEPELNGTRYGQLIHPTTNPETLSKAYSNGCVGMAEGDTWRLYYYAPIGTKVIFRYDLEIKNEQGEKVLLKDIYKQKIVRAEIPVAGIIPYDCECLCEL